LPVPVTIHKGAAEPSRGLVIYFTMEDRYPMADMAAAENIRRIAAHGFDVAVPQVRGTGATRVSDMNSAALYSMALGRPLFAARLGDLRTVIDWLLAQPGYRSTALTLWGE